MEQQLDKQITIETRNIPPVPPDKLKHFYRVTHHTKPTYESYSEDKSIRNYFCYATFYFLRDGIIYNDLHSIDQTVINTNNISPEIFEKILGELTGIFGFDYSYEYHEDLNAHYFEIIFDKKPNMGHLKFVLDSLRYVWELNVLGKTPNSTELNLDLSGIDFIENYYKWIKTNFVNYSGHGINLITEYEKRDNNMNKLIDTVKKFPDGPKKTFLSDFLLTTN